MVEAQAREVEVVNTAVEKLNTDTIPQKPSPAVHLPTVPFALTFTMSPSLTAPQTNVAHHSPMPS